MGVCGGWEGGWVGVWGWGCGGWEGGLILAGEQVQPVSECLFSLRSEVLT